MGNTRAWARLTAAMLTVPLLLAGALTAPAAYGAEGAGAISGVVRDSAGMPVTDVVVSVHAVDGNGYLDAISDEHGEYVVPDIPDGDYVVQFGSWEDDGTHPIEWYPGVRDRESAQAVSVAGDLVAGIDAQLQPPASISGIVVDEDTWDPIGGLDVAVYLAVPDAPSYVTHVYTAPDGAYTIGRLWADDYLVSFGVDTSGAHASQWWENAADSASASTVTLAAGEAREGIDAELGEAGIIEGRVTDATGRPLEGALVYVYSSSSELGWAAEGRTDDEGRYSVRGLDSDEYLVRFSPPVDGLLEEWWNDAPTRAEASPIPLWGRSAFGIDAQLAAGSAITGTVSEALGAVDNVPVYAFPIACTANEDWIVLDRTDSSGRYELTGLTQGQYRIRFGEEDVSRPWAVQWWDGASTCGTGATVTVDGDNDVTGIDALLGETIRGKVTGAGGAALAGVDVRAYLQLPDGALLAAGAVSDASGGFDLPGLRTGTYEVRIGENGLPGQYLGTTVDVSVEAGESPAPVSVSLALRHVDLATPKITGTAQVGKTLTASASPAGVTYGYQWLADGAVVSGATAPTFTPTAAQLGKKLSVRVTASKGGFASATKTSAATAAVAAGTLTAGTPTITGTAKSGSKLTVSPGAWTSGATLSYQWNAGGAAVRGATSSTFTPGAAQVGEAITVTVTGSLAGYTPVSKMSAPTAKVAGLILKSATPKVSGTVAVGSKVTAKPGTWTGGTKLTYQWYAGGKAIKGATKSSFTLTTSQAGKQVTVKVTGSKSGYASASKMSKATVKVATVATPKITGTAKVGKKLTVKPGSWTKGTKFSYQWYANGKAIKGATKSSFTLKSAQKGKAITVKVTGKKSGHATVSKTSKATKKVS